MGYPDQKYDFFIYIITNSKLKLFSEDITNCMFNPLIIILWMYLLGDLLKSLFMIIVIIIIKIYSNNISHVFKFTTISFILIIKLGINNDHQIC